ncbi:gluconokinase [Microbacterium horticulturae]|uniref:Gluconokinase n=1 Tax=Microbacterium horticulturae TaxID=3028316 RepID=A0ABY8C2S0_9MICO|nr:gluconokinase [Microbacterium sp. KACC 23027]WEG08913.1 gluconokinase [Microbacterium sp. KACC 23027]
MDAKPLVVVMGVSGSGKSTIGSALAEKLGVAFIDGDDLHPQANVDKMHAGHPLTDDDRWPWLARVGQALDDAGDDGLVIACSALKRSYRDAILSEEPRALFLHLTASQGLIAGRLEHRDDHFMPPALLDSQFETLEPLGDDEPGVAVDVGEDVAHVVSSSVDALRVLQRR